MSPTPYHEIALPDDRTIVATRTFEVPRAALFDAWTRPALLRRWYGPPGWSFAVCEIDLQVGGRWRFVMRDPDGREIGLHGSYRELTPTRIVNTESWEDWDPGECIVTTDFAARDGRTTLTNTAVYPTPEVLRTLLDSSLEADLASSFERLAALLGATTWS
jgi:uncharacterized protein YndB with AHSA1/START domain